ncbi:MAG TPA: ammonium transporter [Thermoanaerobaculia bacterium]|nr:ammonium transporter [Thermoanaerobaculia bacterium]
MPTPIPPPAINGADTAWMMAATALVLLMTPALAFFYGGLVRSKNALNTMMMSFAALAAVGLAWALAGYSLAFGDGGPLLGGVGHLLLRGVGLEAHGTLPHLLFMAYQGTFAIITAALISGAVVERMRFGPYVAFITLWSLAVYAPVCHWVWGGGWLGTLGAIDFAGGTVVHVNAGAAALVAAAVLGPRRDYGRQALLPHNVPFVLLGGALLWFGWFGFNAGSALAANATAGLAFTNTLLAPIATLAVWMALDRLRTRKTTAVGAATGIVVGLVAITPAAGYVGPMAALVLGAIAAFPSYYAILWRSRTRLDDSLDVTAAHGVGGLVGALLTGVLASAVWGGKDGLLAGNPGQLARQAAAVAATLLYSGTASFALLKLIGAFVPLRAERRQESLGLDVPQHGEEAYTSGEGAILVLPEPVTPAASPVPAAVAGAIGGAGGVAGGGVSRARAAGSRA